MYKQSFRALSVLLLLALLSANVSADPVKVGNLYYNFVLKAKIASVTAPPFEEGEENEYGEVSGKCYEGDVVIPATVEYKGVVCNVTSIEDKAFCCLKKAYLTNPQLSENNKLTSVSIPESVTSIGTQAFYCCVKLSSISLPESVSKIGDSAFSGCTGLVSAKLKGLTTIPAGLFASCTSLETLDISENITEIGSSAFASCVNLPSVDLKNVEKIDDYAFYRCSKLITINMSDNLKKIGRDAFRECSNLSTIKWSENLREIDDGAFYYCKALNSVELPNNVKSIGVVAFSDCSNLMTVKIGSNLLKLGQSAFANCIELTDVYIYGQLPSTYAPPFNDSMVEYSTLHVPAGFINFCKENSPWNEFGDYVALSDEDLGLDTEKSKRIITFEDPQVKAICVSNWDFNGDGELSEAEAAMPVSFSNIALWDSDNNGEFDSEEIRIAEGTYEFVSVFKGNTKIKTFNELKYFTGLKYFTEKEMKCIEVDAFYGCTNLEKVTLPEGVTIIDVRAFGGCSSLSSVMIPDNVTTLGSYAFYQCSNLTSVTIGEKVQRIGDWAFFGCSCVTSIIIPESVTEIGNTAFSHSGLTSVSLPSGITKIEAETFGNCTNLTTVTIPNSVTEIGDYAFYSSGLTSVTIPQSVKRIGINAFATWDSSSLKEVRSLIKDPFPLEESSSPFASYEYAHLYVPVGTKDKYDSAEGWNLFNTVTETEIADANCDGEVDEKDVKAIVKHIVGENPGNLDEKAADVNNDNNVNVADVVELNNLLKVKKQ